MMMNKKVDGEVVPVRKYEKVSRLHLGYVNGRPFFGGPMDGDE